MKQGTEAALIRAATKAFAKHGFEGASVRDITAAAGTNLGAITYHFGSKQNLYERVIEVAAEPLMHQVVAAAQSAAPPITRVREVVRIYFSYLVSNPEFARIMLQELSLGRTPPEVATTAVRTIHGALIQLVKEGQQNGDFRAGDARIMAFGIISQSLHVNLIRHALKHFTSIDLGDAQTRESVLEHLADFACAGLSAKGTTT